MICLTVMGGAQEAFNSAPVTDLDEVNGWVSGIRSNGLVIHETLGGRALISDEGLNSDAEFVTRLYYRGETWNSYEAEPLSLSLPYRQDASLGTLGSAGDTVVVFSLDRDFGEWKEGSILLGRFNRGLIDQLSLVLAAPSGVRHLHPAITADQQQIVFASNMPGGAGGFDLYFTNRLRDGWSEPVSLGGVVNTPKHEVFPVWHGSTVYFSSNGHPGLGKLDIYAVTRESQWLEMRSMGEPFNSRGDDFAVHWLCDDDAFLNSDREGYDRVYRLTRERRNPLAEGLRAELLCAGEPVQGVKVQIRNTLDELVLDQTTQSNGGFDIATLELKRSYRAYFEGAPAAVLNKSLLYIIDSEGKRIMVFSAGRDGSYIFELMPFSDLDGLTMLDDTDDSRLLSVAVEGQIYEETPGDIGEGELIYIEKPDGELLALTYTGEGGHFKFDELSPQMEYTFKFDEDRNTLKMIIIDRGEERSFDVIDGRVDYKRIVAGEAIELQNEKGENIAIRKDERFIVDNIYYAFAAHELNEAAKVQLKRLSMILMSNPELTIELSSHTDSRGSDSYNLELSKRRAARCVEFLAELGVEPARLKAVGYGETRLLNQCDDEAECDEVDHAVNRRTELRLR